jgi:N-acetylglucosamine kinase-like BadF-type ATPase
MRDEGKRRVLVLGVDGGGTSTDAWLAEPGCRVLGRGKAGPSNAKAIGPDAARRALDLAIRAAFHDAGLAPEPACVACLGLAGFDRPADRGALVAWCEEARWADRLVTANDGDLVIAAGTPQGWGIGVIAGTGSIAVGRTPDGRIARAGGWGHKIGDEGSAYAVVLDALRLVARRADGRESPPTDRDVLTERLCAALGVSEPSEIVTAIYAPDFDRTRMAALAPEVLAACLESPEASQRLLSPAGVALAEMVFAVARKLGWSRGALPLGAAGGFLLSATPVLQAMIHDLSGHGYQVAVTQVPDPVRGAVLLAERALDAALDPLAPNGERVPARAGEGAATAARPQRGDGARKGG